MYSILLGGIVPFAIIFLNWHEFLTSAIRGEYMLSIDYTVIVSILLFVATSEITVVLIFLQLCAEVKIIIILSHVSKYLILFSRIISGGGNPS